MGKTFDIGLERLTGAGVGGLAPEPAVSEGAGMKASATVGASIEEKNRTLKTAGCGTHRSEGETFYLETFGCQMNDNDSEKVAGVLLGRGYRQVETPEAAKVILYNTCSIREKAAQKVFSRLGELRPAEERNGKRFNTEDTEAEHRVHGDSGVLGKDHPSLRKIVNAGGGKIIGVL